MGSDCFSSWYLHTLTYSLTRSEFFSEKIILIFVLNYIVCCFVYVSDGMMCIEDTVLNRSVYNKYLFEAFHFC